MERRDCDLPLEGLHLTRPVEASDDNLQAQ